ncbi:tRNA nucleotidyltransferase (CCA-adding enzyme) [Sedimentibacter acidaminivorans]|uniref:tRNA nucleotidyltransferase (CCA-adding enzyme) n=1 Tax=Sedimentibacter acidaminivorans TaxID=913099 RepID=A0ABS4GH57_9FIRM|nr:hypothetical protein [Sedimentibacter acidaminivorans]MBP1926957.1 tRNA nucleotidyltransferase (CCA-adding enzyme) [Sedimentibacter acidaminivorans]
MVYKIKMPVEVETAINILNINCFDAYVVGGCVRDSILEIEPSDWDIATSAQPHDIIKCFKGYKVIETGIKHGTVTVIISNMILEITTYRIDGEYKDNRRPEDVKFTTDIAHDLERRDFTINAMAYNHESGLVDLYGGIKDIELKTIRCVGKPDKRFSEDGLRILRALRFASVLGFEIECNTSASIYKNKSLLTNISSERIVIELNKLITGYNFKNILNEYRYVLAVFIPEIERLFNDNKKSISSEYDLWENTLDFMANVTNDLHLRLATMFHGIGITQYSTNEREIYSCNEDYAKKSSNIAFNIMKNLKYDRETVEIVRMLVLYHNAKIQPISKDIKRWLNKIGIEIFNKLLLIKKAYIELQENLIDEKSYDIKQIEFIFNNIIENNQCYNLRDLEVNGTDLIEIGLPKGKCIGLILNELLDLVIDEELENNKEVLTNYVMNKKYLDNIKI